MDYDHQKSLTEYLSAFIEELHASGVKKVVISPGSRSTPLALLFAKHPNVEVFINIDERSAAFFALGMAKADNEPVAILCTSGTAAANYFPAVIEAHYSRVPLVVLTADRPHELREIGAPQAINQINLFGSHVKWFDEMALPEHTDSMIQYARRAASRGAALARSLPEGPVHFNFPLREPLVPDMNHSFKEGKVQTAVTTSSGSVSSAVLERLSQILAQKQKGIIVCGPQADPGVVDAVIRLSEKVQFPVLADPLSSLRSGTHDKSNVIDGYDSFLRIEKFKKLVEPDIVIRVGAMPVSKALTLYLKNQDIEHWVVDSGGLWRDPAGKATEMIFADEAEFLNALSDSVKTSPPNESWLETWVGINQKTQEMIAGYHVGNDSLDEGMAVKRLIGALPEDSIVFASNSMPIRDLDTFFLNNDKRIKVMGNRGANGIDGVVSTALGVSVCGQPTYLVIGDLAFYHDMNGLLAGKMCGLNLKILLVNNNGGGIFSYLPQAKEKDHFEHLFGTPADLDFSHAANLYGAEHSKADTLESLEKSLSDWQSAEGISIIEAVTNRDENVRNHREMWNNVSREIEKLL
ncbi:2-succinyl-5-enolpyruvyl-6-hydroxy-3-cyclohexene-1-carboxylic-acid synthase [Rossellomorea vietnamensis]|uniref:2-succinyl-5-enolpyruvyl-6-hydroxy-3-cyclohexene-1-carboxylate synthase n=1 Tax=Rossellomorea vietnamensis TaxID=218284 RepID=A0A5D4MBJ0_9BACI|nr:2-succinyl-5-enolpyruvyl-6-hydroxy-3-cyclohexene-1-carboxylic-acid synthase [Rossellomorea vietnamensis]TYR98340.1 2-succinyl-5-enolpyruvyl-6-hydroxy-3-cyclohexene-1-carboxylic-acid synthase [Rossellomorea vietnamensis]